MYVHISVLEREVIKLTKAIAVDIVGGLARVSGSCLMQVKEAQAKLRLQRPTAIADNLWAQKTDLSSKVNEQWPTIQRWFSTLLAWGILTAD